MQTAVVHAAAGRSHKTSLVTASAAASTMLLLTPVLGLLPNATLAAVVIVYSVGLIQPAEFIAIRKVRTMEFRWAIVAALGVLMFGTLNGIVVAIILSLIGLSRWRSCAIPGWPNGLAGSACCSTHARRSNATRRCRQTHAA